MRQLTRKQYYTNFFLQILMIVICRTFFQELPMASVLIWAEVCFLSWCFMDVFREPRKED